MTDNRQFAEKTEKSGASSQGNLGQKQAAREETADEKLEHMGDKKSSQHEQAKDQKRRDK